MVVDIVAEDKANLKEVEKRVKNDEVFCITLKLIKTPALGLIEYAEEDFKMYKACPKFHLETKTRKLVVPLLDKELIQDESKDSG